MNEQIVEGAMPATAALALLTSTSHVDIECRKRHQKSWYGQQKKVLLDEVSGECKSDMRNGLSAIMIGL